MSSITAPRSIFLGQLRRDFCISHDGKIFLDFPGGNALYAAVGMLAWEPDSAPGLVARVGEDFPLEWLADFEQRGINIRGVRVLPEAIDLRSFYVYTDRATRISDDPFSYFAKLGSSFPRQLLGYRADKNFLDSRTQLTPVSLRQADITADYHNATAAHLCPLDYLSHTLVPAVLRQAGFTTITLDPSPGTMNAVFWNDIPAMITGLTAFLPNEDELRSLFHGRSNDLWEMAAALSAYGCEFVIVKRGERGQLLYDASTKSRWEIPAYPARLVNPTGAGDAFCGGFLSGYRKTFDPLQAVLYGNIVASLVVEGNGAFYALDALPGLAQARMEALHNTVHKI